MKPSAAWIRDMHTTKLRDVGLKICSASPLASFPSVFGERVSPVVGGDSCFHAHRDDQNRINSIGAARANNGRLDRVQYRKNPNSLE
jgi:hypothetical protein